MSQVEICTAVRHVALKAVNQQQKEPSLYVRINHSYSLEIPFNEHEYTAQIIPRVWKMKHSPCLAKEAT